MGVPPPLILGATQHLRVLRLRAERTEVLCRQRTVDQMRGQKLVEPLTPGDGGDYRSHAKRKLERRINTIGQMPTKRQTL